MSPPLYVSIGLTVATLAFTTWMGRRAIIELIKIYSEWPRLPGSSAKSSAEKRIAPSGLLIDLFMPPDRAEDVLYNLLGRYDYWVEKHGRRLALIIFFTQSFGSILTFWIDWMLKRVKLLKMFVSS